MNEQVHSPIETWHALESREALQCLDSDPSCGLSSKESVRRLGEYGSNRLPAGAKRGPLMRFPHQFDNILVYILLGCGLVKLMLGLWLDASITTGVVIINALLGFLQEGMVEKALVSIRNMLSADARALRDGKPRVVAAEHLVPGDIVLLESGDRIPADLRLIDVKNLRADEAALTGESVPADNMTEAVPNSTVGDRSGARRARLQRLCCASRLARRQPPPQRILTANSARKAEAHDRSRRRPASRWSAPKHRWRETTLPSNRRGLPWRRGKALSRKSILRRPSLARSPRRGVWA